MIPQETLAGAVNFLSELIFPNYCVGCNTRGAQLCGGCISGFRSPDEMPCVATAIFSYQNKALRKALWNLKYNSKRHIGKILGERIVGEVIDILSEQVNAYDRGNLIIIPIPLSKSRRRERDFNQSEIIAKPIAKASGIKLETRALAKIHDTPRQVSQHSKRDRLRNLRGAFIATKPERVRAKDVILIDDIITTGATMIAACAALQEAAPRSITPIAVAH